MLAVVKYPSLIKEHYRVGLLGLYYTCYEIKYVPIPFHNFYKNSYKLHKRRNQLRGGNRYD